MVALFLLGWRMNSVIDKNLLKITSTWAQKKNLTAIRKRSQIKEKNGKTTTTTTNITTHRITTTKIVLNQKKSERQKKGKSQLPAEKVVNGNAKRLKAIQTAFTVINRMRKTN